MFDGDNRIGRTAVARILFAAVTLAFLTVPVSSAFALDKDQIIQMSKMGIGAESIKGAIDNADESFELTPEELGEMRVQGVSDEIIEYLKEGGHVAGETATGDEEGGETEAAEAETPAPDEKEPDETEPDEPEPGEAEADETEADEEQAEKEETDEEDEPTETADADETDEADEEGEEGGAPAPAPGDLSEEERKELSEEEIEKLKEQARKEGAEQLEEEKRMERKRQQAARRLPEAAENIEDGNLMAAARIYLRFLSLDPEEGSDNWYEAKFGLAKSLYKQGILSGAATPIREVVMAGADRPHFEEAFRILEELTRKIGYQPPALEELTQTLTEDLPAEFQNDFNYYLGKFFYDYNRNELAVNYLEKVDDGAADYPESRYLMGVAQLDPSIDDKPAALRNFETAITAGEEQKESNEEILQLGYLALARVFYEVGLYDVALFYYQKIPRDSSRHAEAMFERAWTYFLKNDYKRALGTFHTLHSPYYEKWYYPDLYILESTVYLNLCRFDYSKRALAEFQTRYLDKRPRLQKFLEETTKPKEYWEKMAHAYKQDGITKNGTLPEMFANAVLDDLEFYNIYKKVRLLRKERRALKDNIGALGDFGQEVLDSVDKQLETKVEEGGILVQQKLTEIDQELKDWDLKATQISFDIDSEEKEQLERRLRKKEAKESVSESGTTLLIVADDWQPWPYEGEYWFDEVSNYRSRQRSRCIEQ